MIIRGQKVLKVKKFDYTKNPEAQRFVAVKAVEHMPEWKKKVKEELESEYKMGGKFEKINCREQQIEENRALRLEDLV